MKLAGLVLIAGFLAAFPAWAGATSYDLNVPLHQRHPFAASTPPPSYGSVPEPIPATRLHQPARVPFPIAEPAPAGSATSQTVAQRRPSVMAQPTGETVGPHERRRGWGILSEIRAGFLIHDQGPFSSNEEDGYDGNLEILFTSPRFLDVIWSPRPHLGVTVNTEGDTSQAYFGLSWEWSFWGNWFAGFSFGGSVHNGELKTSQVDRKELGCRLLFRESVEAGYRFGGRHSVSLFLDHISNARLCSRNEGLENWGIRYGYSF